MPRKPGKANKHDPKTWFWPFGQPESLKSGTGLKSEEKEESEKPEKKCWQVKRRLERLFKPNRKKAYCQKHPKRLSLRATT